MAERFTDVYKKPLIIIAPTQSNQLMALWPVKNNTEGHTAAGSHKVLSDILDIENF